MESSDALAVQVASLRKLYVKRQEQCTSRKRDRQEL